ncbi:MAG: site-specific recombinase, invertase Pin [Glaciihabitans sp.]|nr:site-specific recombinase, invertase Pin [Glaciihabitans sp.]
MLRAAIYARISDNPDVAATADQIRRCEELAAREGYEVVARYADDNISAYGGKARPDWIALQHAIKTKRVDIVLAVADDRLARDAVEKIGFQVACAKAGVKWHTIAGGLVDPATAGGALMSTITAGIAQYESQVKSERVAASVVRRRLEGKDIGGPRPFGFTTDRSSLIEAEAELVRAGHRLVLSGASTYAVVKMFMTSGVPPVRAQQWSYVIVRKILTRPRNAALAMTEAGEKFELTEHPAIVSREDHEAVNAILTSSSQPIGRRPQHLASGGVARCGVCGAPLRFQAQKDGIYRCTAANNGLGAVDGRTHPSVKAADVDAQMITEIVPALMARLARGDGAAEGDGAVSAMLLQRAELERQRDAAQDLYLLPGANKARVRASLASFAEQIELVDTRIADVRGAGSAAVQAIAAALLEGAPSGAALGARFKEVWGGMTLEDQRALVRALLDVKIHPASIARKLKIEHLPDGTAEVVVVREGPERIAIRRI